MPITWFLRLIRHLEHFEGAINSNRSGLRRRSEAKSLVVVLFLFSFTPSVFIFSLRRRNNKFLELTNSCNRLTITNLNEFC